MKPRVFATLLSLSLAPTYAGVIVDFSPPAVGGGLGVAAAPRVATPNPGNDNPAGAGASPNVVEITKRFDHVAEIDMEFRVRNTGASTEYFFTDTVTNNTGVDWTDFHFELGFGTGANFVRSGLLDFLDFDCPIPGVPAPTSGVFARLAHHCNTIDWDMGVVKAGAMTVFTFSIDTPDMLAALFDNANPPGPVPASARIPNDGFGAFPNGGYRFTLREIPTVTPTDPPPDDRKQGEALPEPGSIGFMLFGCAALATCRRFARRS